MQRPTASSADPYPLAAMSTPSDTKKANRRLALILASVVAVFFLGFVVKMTMLGG